MNQLEEHITWIEKSGCMRCPDLAQIRTKIVVARGNTEADVVIVGQNPGAKEDEGGQPFLGKAGQMLDNIILNAGFEPNRDFFFTNVVMCHTDKNNPPTIRHTTNCQIHLVKMLQPFDKIVAVGKSALMGVLNYLAPTEAARQQDKMVSRLLTKGFPMKVGQGSSQKYLFFTYHPSYLCRSGVQHDQTDNNEYSLLMQELIAAKEYEVPSGISDDSVSAGGMLG